jgi:hypothetical protein
MKKLFFVVSLLISIAAQAQSPDWFIPSKPAATIFFQGIFASQLQCAKYTGKRPLITTTLQRALCPEALDLMLIPFIGKELDEIVLHNRASSSIFTDPSQALHKLATYAQEKLWGTIDARDYNFTVSPPHKGAHDIRAHSVNASHMNFGQEKDIHEHKQRYDLCVAQHPDNDYILYGVSRGAATTFSAFATHHFPKVKLVVLEGCYDSLEHVIKTSYSGALHAQVFSALATFTSYKPHHMSPISLVERFPENVPVVFVHSRQDKRVPYQCAHMLATVLAQRGKNPVYFITLHNSTHSRYHKDNKADALYYQRCLHTIYKKYGLPYIPAYAQESESYVDACLLSR